ncbi:hypothetical protein [Chromobacterium phragmitis]|uniref:Lipoprotein n=1 Tax=Chromobacterium phragmitis TaxID=2202141 RepID=A0A344UEM6_9NEIS|nr:hypothetical protein [Chromobacterium phragmitis]AXE33724.1 hypothetical protein DK843_04960 [Chromobacterium phragmitis]
MKSFLAIVMTAFMLTACQGSNPAQEELLSYLNKDIKPLAGIEEEVIGEYNSVSGDNYQDDEVMHDKLVNVIRPKYASFLTALEKIKPATPEVRALHEQYIDAATEQSHAMDEIVTALEEQDSSKMNAANQKLDSARKKFREFNNKLEDTAKQLDVELGADKKDKAA